MKMNQLIVERESDNIRKMSRLSIFNQKRFWMQEEEKQQTEEILIEFNKLKLDEPILKLEQQNLRKFCKNFQSFEYYNGEPICINDYFIRILPVGQRCIVSSYQGVTILQTINGLKHKFSSSLPGGSQKTLIGRCILDCFLCSNTVYIYDIMQWGKMDMSEQVAELRYFWIKGHILSQLRQDQELEDYNFEWIPIIPSINELQKTIFPYTKNGLLFIRKDSYYFAGVNPECFIYQDEFTDENFKEESIKYKFDNSITLTLSLFQNELKTRDGYQIAQYQSNKNTKEIVDAKVTITNKELILVDIKDPSKFLEDPYSKIMFWKWLPRLRIQ
ncbi:unnamed protein product [Paramecium pentaurelia]|uniref:Snurportin-1 n=1 Tax=Paramecium pentaurelia TaxID=43138 RepID=A0A8S1UFL0_9CILI|nr:unnamed protein product [Paramecium pentaurelia]